MKTKIIIWLLTLSLLLSQNLFCAEKIKLSSLDWKPYIGKSLNNEGYAAEVVKKAF
jgi:hypothetical protein